MNLETIIAEQRRILDRIERECVDPVGNSKVISDGIVCPEIYTASSPRILWILKEPYDNGDSYGATEDGGWSLTDHCMNQKTDETARKMPFQPICYIDYGIRKKIHDWHEMPDLEGCEEIRNSLKKIAYINISKLPGLKSSPNKRIADAYKKHHELIFDQIRTYAPDIIFACDPHANLILQDYGFSQSQWRGFGSAASIHISPVLRLVRIGHPSRKEKAPYVNDAIKAATAELVAEQRSDS